MLQFRHPFFILLKKSKATGQHTRTGPPAHCYIQTITKSVIIQLYQNKKGCELYG